MSAVSIPLKQNDYLSWLGKITLCNVEEGKEKLKKMKMGQDFCQELEQNGIFYTWCIRHPEVVSCIESRHYYQRYQEYFQTDYSICKHLLVQERKGEKRIFLIVVEDEKEVDLHQMQEVLNCSKLEFVSKEKLESLLHTYSGNISIFHLKYDINHQIKLVMDQDLLHKKLLAFHPLYNGMSVFIEPKYILKYLKIIGCQKKMISIPEKQYVLKKVL